MDKAVRTLMLTAAAIVICAGCQERVDSQVKLTEGRGRQRKVMSLAGQWLFRLDPQNIGEQEKWHKSILNDRINLPGSVPENGYGDDVTVDTKWTGQIVDRSWFTDAKYEKYRQPGAVKIPFWLTPVKHYVGPAWYQKRLDIPRDWMGRRIILFLERCHWETKVWVDDNVVGVQDSLCTPHV
jgi:beta-galactosidase/beta-glucuronidase